MKIVHNILLVLSIAGATSAARADYPYNAGAFEMTGKNPRVQIIGRWIIRNGNATAEIEFGRGGDVTMYLGGRAGVIGTYRFVTGKLIEMEVEAGMIKRLLRHEIAFKRDALLIRNLSSSTADAAVRYSRVR